MALKDYDPTPVWIRNTEPIVVSVDGGVSIEGDVIIDEVTLGAGSAAIGKLAANSGVDIGDVDVPLATTVFQDTDTLTTAGSREALVSHGGLKFGVYITNTHATAIVYIGTAAAVSATAYISALAPGQTSPMLPVENTNLLGYDSNTSGATITYGGF